MVNIKVIDQLLKTASSQSAFEWQIKHRHWKK